MFTHASIEHVRAFTFAVMIIAPAVLCWLASMADRLFPARFDGALVEAERVDAHIAVKTARTLFQRAAYTEVKNARLAQAGRHGEVNRHLPRALRMQAVALLASVVGGIATAPETTRGSFEADGVSFVTTTSKVSK